jgi:hypothetical protein
MPSLRVKRELEATESAFPATAAHGRGLTDLHFSTMPERQARLKRNALAPANAVSANPGSRHHPDKYRGTGRGSGSSTPAAIRRSIKHRQRLWEGKHAYIIQFD